MTHKHSRKEHSAAASTGKPPQQVAHPTSPKTSEQSTVAAKLSPPATYLPFADGRYHVTPNLFSFATDFGNGPMDQQLFQIDEEFAQYRQNKQYARDESLNKYVCVEQLDVQTARTLHAFIIDTLTKQQPRYFQRRQENKNRVALQCRLTEETLVFDTDFEFLPSESYTRNPQKYVTGIDALAAQVQEDFAVVKTSEDNDRLIALHLCAPNHWAAREKIGQSFLTIHRSVAGMDAVNQKSRPLLNALLHRGPFVRFAWGLATDRRLNHHPEAPAGFDAAQWAGRKFGNNEELYLRVERQTLHGFPAADIIFFTIRTYFYSVSDLVQNPQNKTQLISAIASMTPEQLRYKGLFEQRDVVLNWIQCH